MRASVSHGTYYFSGVLKGLLRVNPRGSHHLIAQGSIGPLLFFLILFLGAASVAALLRRFFSSPGPSDSASSGGGGGSPPMPRGPGPGGVPLDDAQPADVRLRDERRLARRLPAR